MQGLHVFLKLLIVGKTSEYPALYTHDNIEGNKNMCNK